jgi:hypothetical protein
VRRRIDEQQRGRHADEIENFIGKQRRVVEYVADVRHPGDEIAALFSS